jgi:hypothetical protein
MKGNKKIQNGQGSKPKEQKKRKEKQKLSIVVVQNKSGLIDHDLVKELDKLTASGCQVFLLNSSGFCGTQARVLMSDKKNVTEFKMYIKGKNPGEGKLKDISDQMEELFKMAKKYLETEN